MKIKNRALKVVLWIVAILLIPAIIGVILGYSYLRFYVVPKINTNAIKTADNVSVSDIIQDLGDKQIIDNIINFDKASAHEILNIMNQLEQEQNAENAKDSSKKEEVIEQEPKKDVNKEGTTAYERILSEANKEEISQGASILAKINMAKVNEFRKNGDMAGLKAYIQSVLSPSEISAALKLYNKYKHLL
ncbi:MAG: hypothetical protein IK057_02210 [Clostridia bacterium]|nr:hypothetical protein [Clostridia bacterium]